MAQAASLAELASIQPMAGGQYYWTYVSDLDIQFNVIEADRFEETCPSTMEAISDMVPRMDNRECSLLFTTGVYSQIGASSPF